MKKLLGILVLGLLLSGNAYAGKFEKNFHPRVGMSFAQFCNEWDSSLPTFTWKRHVLQLKQSNGWITQDGPQCATNYFPFYQGWRSSDSGVTPLRVDSYISGTIILKILNKPEIYYIDKKKLTLFKIDNGEHMQANKNNTQSEGSSNMASSNITFTINDKKKQCKAIGFKPQTEKFADCVLKLVELDVKTQQNNQISAAQSSGNDALVEELRKQRRLKGSKALMDLGKDLMTPKAPASLPKTTHCRIWGNNITCN